MTPRARVLAALNHNEADRVPIHDSPWVSTIDRWHKEGMPADINPAEYLDYEFVCFGPHGDGVDTSPRFPVKVLEETEEYVIHTTPYGGVWRNLNDHSATPEIIDYPCKSQADWERMKERLTPSWDRVDWQGEWLTDTADDERGHESTLATGRCEWRRGLPGCKRAREQGEFVCYSAGVGYGRIQSYVASERLLIAIATEPNWVRDMYETDASLVIEMYEIMKKGGFEFDGAWLFCDLGYRNGLLFSPRHFDEQLRPTFQRLFDYFRAEGMPVLLHSDGRVRDLIPRFIEDGLTCLQPLEVKAGMDLIELKKEFGDRIALMGGIDVRAMADPDPSLIEEEIRAKIPFAKRGGGYIYHSDHSVPNNVPFDRYSRVLELVRKYGAY